MKPSLEATGYGLKTVGRTLTRAVCATVLGAAAFGPVSSAMGAVYNLYFNNTEQGPNSVANPHLVVSPNGQVTGAQAGTTGTLGPDTTTTYTPVPTASADPAYTPPPVPTPAPVVSPAIDGQEVPPAGESRTAWGRPFQAERNWRLTAAFSGQKESFQEPGAIDEDGLGAVATLSYLPLSYFGFNLFGGIDSESRPIIGGEIEIVPLKFTIFGFNNKMEIGVLGGASNLGTAPGNLASLHVGARVGWNFGDDRWLLNVAVRGNDGFIMADTGVGLRF